MHTKFLVGAMGLVLGLSLVSVAQAAQPDMERVWIKFHDGQRASVGNALRSAGAEVHHNFENLNAFAVSVPVTALDGLSRNPNIEYIEPDVQRFPMAQVVPYGIDMVQARDVWDVNRDGIVDAGAPTGSNVLICVIDSGLRTAHEDFASVNVVGGHPAGWNDDSCGHGTHVAGTINAANNNKGVVGVSPGGASLYIVQVFNGASCGWSYSSDLVNAANVCAQQGANIISMSLGGSRSVRSEQNAFASLESQGILSIAAAGNDGSTRKSYPASYPSVVSVAAIDANKNVAGFSQKNDAVELAAPGVSVLSTVPWTGASFTVSNNSFAVSVMEGSAATSRSGALVNGGRCTGGHSWPTGVVALCERGDISFADKVNNAYAGGARAVVIYNNEPGAFAGTLGGSGPSGVPVVSMAREDGLALVAGSLGATATVNTDSQPGSGYEAWDGTSMATPHVSGVAALVWGAVPGATNTQIREALAITAQDLGASGRDTSYGWGLVQAAAAIAHLNGGGGGGAIDPPSGLSATGSYQRNKFNVSLSWANGASSVDIYRNGTRISTRSNSGSYSESLRLNGSGTLTYQVCDAGTSDCSNTASVNY